MSDKLFARVSRVGHHFDGLIVQLGRDSNVNEIAVREVLAIVPRDVTIGDREVTLPLPENMMFINEEFLDLIDNFEVREFDSKNPYGKFIRESTVTVHSTSVKMCEFESCLQVSVLNGLNDVVFSNNYYSYDFIEEAKNYINEIMEDDFLDEYDAIDSVIETLADLADREEDEEIYRKRNHGF